MQKILDQRDDQIIAELTDMRAKITVLPQRVPQFLYALTATLRSRNDEIRRHALLNAQLAAQRNFTLVSQHFIRQGDFETLLEIAPFAGPNDYEPLVIYLAKQAYDKPERFCHIALRITVGFLTNKPTILTNEKLLTPLVRACERALGFQANAELALSVLARVAQLGYLPNNLKAKVQRIAGTATGTVQIAAYEVLGMASDEVGYVSGVSRRRRSFRTQAPLEDEELHFIHTLGRDAESPELDSPISHVQIHKWSPQHGVPRGRPFAPASMRGKKEASSVGKLDLVASDCRSTGLEHINTQLRAIFGNQRDSLAKQSKFDLLHFLKRTEPCLSLIEFGLRVRLVNFLLMYLDESIEIITPWLRELPHCKVYLQDTQFQALKNCVQSAMLTQHACYPELQVIYKQMKEQLLHFGFQRQ